MVALRLARLWASWRDYGGVLADSGLIGVSVFKSLTSAPYVTDNPPPHARDNFCWPILQGNEGNCAPPFLRTSAKRLCKVATEQPKKRAISMHSDLGCITLKNPRCINTADPWPGPSRAVELGN